MSYYEDYGITEEDLKQNYHYAIDEIIEKIVEEKLKERVEDLSKIREEQKRYGEHLIQLSEEKKELQKKEREALRQVELIQKQCEQEIEKIRKESFDKLFGEFIDLKGNKKDIYYIKSSKYYEPCPYCNDKGTFEKNVDGMIGKFDCPICNNKRDLIEVNIWRTKKSSYYDFSFDNKLRPALIIRNFGGYDDRISLSEIYFNKEKAEKKQDAKNKIVRDEAKLLYQKRIDKLSNTGR